MAGDLLSDGRGQFVDHDRDYALQRLAVVCPSGRRMLRADLFRPGDPDCAGVVHEVGGLGHVQAGRAKQQQHSAGDDGEQDAIHGQTQGDRRRVALNA